MTAFLTWNKDWLLGIDALDSQHKVLADRLNRLVVECRHTGAAPTEKNGHSRDLLARLFQELYITTKEHFSFEEALMCAEDYPGLAAHAREHVMLIAELKSTFVNGVKEGRCKLDPEFLQALKSWLIAHVTHSDREFAEFLKEKNRSVPATSQSEH
ncbi:MAG TPA: bacteriohemerythrin [Thiolapillus brandeum]|uniref:Bacteriohemerythrin n=1 Tax=Thiolapillus brandeum TaxID=1076588 RepID=A0A831WBB8_9GAMM|nr:bacteriohemerythrin [Thiolapillus brandeum]